MKSRIRLWAAGEGVSVSATTACISPRSSAASTCSRWGRSITSSKQSRYVSNKMGKSGKPLTACRRSRALSRCSQKGVLLPACSPGSRSARAAFWRNWAPNTAEWGSSKSRRRRASSGPSPTKRSRGKSASPWPSASVSGKRNRMPSSLAWVSTCTPIRSRSRAASTRAQAPLTFPPNEEWTTRRGSPRGSSKTSRMMVVSEATVPILSTCVAT